VQDNEAIRINLAAPARGPRLAGRFTRLRDERGGRRFLFGLSLGLLLGTGAAVAVLSRGASVPPPQAASPWIAAMERETESLPVEVAAALRPLTALVTAIETFERQQPPPPGWIDLLRSKSRADDVAERAAHLLTMDARRRATQELDAWEERGEELARLDGGEREAAIRVLSLARWLIRGGELAAALHYYEEFVAVAVAAKAAADAAAEAEPAKAETAPPAAKR